MWRSWQPLDSRIRERRPPGGCTLRGPEPAAAGQLSRSGPRLHAAGGTGPLPALRGEAGVVTFTGGGRYAVTELIRALGTVAIVSAAGAVIGSVARLAADTIFRATTAAMGCGWPGPGDSRRCDRHP